MDETINIRLDVRVPQRFAPAFLKAVTGDDDCLLLAVEKVIRAKVGESFMTDNVEVDSLAPEFRDDLELWAQRERAERRTYGPYVDEDEVGDKSEVFDV